MQSIFLFFFSCGQRERWRKWCRHREWSGKLPMNDKEKKRDSCVSGLRISCNLMSLDESWLSGLTQFFALLVTVLNLMMFAPDYWCKSQCWIVFFWSYIFLWAKTPIGGCMCRVLNLAQATHRMTSPTLCSRHPLKTCLQLVLKPPACFYPCSYKHKMQLTMCTLVCADSVYTEKIKKYTLSRGRGEAVICEAVDKYRKRAKWHRVEDFPGRSL